MVEIQYLNNFSTSYQRNNKSSGKKNLRCRATGHTPRQFCGSELSVKITLEENIGYTPQELFFFGEFVQYDLNSNQHSIRKSKLTDELGLEDVTRFVTSDGKNHDGVFVGDLLPNVTQGPLGASCLVEFNKGRLRWPYSWVGTKNSASIHHSFRTVVYFKENSILKVLQEKRSPKFSIYSRRKAKTSKIQHQTARTVELVPEISKYQSFYQSTRVKDLITLEFVKEFQANYAEIREEANLFIRLFNYLIHHSKYTASFPGGNDNESIFSFSKGLFSGFDAEQFSFFQGSVDFGPPSLIREEKQPQENISLLTLIERIQSERKLLNTHVKNEVDLVSELKLLDEIGSDVFNFFVREPEIDEIWRELGQYWAEPGRLLSATILKSVHFSFMEVNPDVELLVLDFFVMSKIAMYPLNQLQEFHTSFDIAMTVYILLFEIVHIPEEGPRNRKNARKLFQVKNILQFLAYEKFIPLDPEYPPATYSFAFMLTQLKQHNNFSLEKFSSLNLSNFPKDSIDQKLWGRAICCFYRNLYQEVMLLSAHILKEKIKENAPRISIIPCGKEISGVDHLRGRWDRMITLSDEEAEGGYLTFVNQLWGLNLGSGFHLMCEDNILKAMNIRFVGPTIYIDFNEFLFFSLKFEFILDGQVHDTDVLNFPFSPKLENKKYVGWVERHSHENSTFRFVVAATLSHYIASAKPSFTNRIKEYFTNGYADCDNLSRTLSRADNGVFVRFAFEVKFENAVAESKITLFFFEGEEVLTTGQLGNKKQRLGFLGQPHQKKSTNLAPNLGNIDKLNLLFGEDETLKQFGTEFVTRKLTYYKSEG
eukprot:maker-scaffold_25-snap-gene-3.65-mRNA-1 protein AED:0.39 eAED:0.42 QI:0/0/0/1/1/1/2/0/820